MAALLLAAVDGARVEARVALAADHLLAVVLAREDREARLDDATAEAEHEVERRLLLDVVVAERAAVLQLLAGEDQALLVGRDALLVLDLGLHVVDGVGGLDVQRDGLAREGLHEDLHGCRAASAAEAMRSVRQNPLEPEPDHVLKISLKTKSGAGYEFLLLLCRAKALVKGMLFHRHPYCYPFT